MIHLKELVQLVGPEFKLCTCTTQTGEAVQTLFNYVRSEDDPTDGGAARALGVEEGASSVRKTKHLLKIELLNAVAGISRTHRTPDRRQRVYAYVWKLIAVGKQLRTSLSSKVLLNFLEEAFDLAAQHELLDAAEQSAFMLQRQYNNRRFDAERYAYYRDKARYFGELARHYRAVVADLNDVMYLRNLRSEPEEIHRMALAATEKNYGLIERYDVPVISYIIYLTQLNAHLAEPDYPKVIEVADTALAYLADRPSAIPAMFQAFEANLCVAYTQLNDYDNGMAFAHRLLEKTESGAHNYFKVYELMLTLTLRAGRFTEAYHTYTTVAAEIPTADVPAYYEETFRIIEAYLYLLVAMKKIQPRADDDRFERFRISRFLNSFRQATTEKSQRNVHLLIIQLVDDIIRKRHGDTTYSIEAIRKYVQRHLRGKGHERVRYFMKALAQLSEQRFHRVAVERHTARYLKKLSSYPLEESRHDLYTELIPYETLWAMILEQLGYRRVRKPRRAM